MRRQRAKAALTSLMGLTCLALAWTIYEASGLSTGSDLAVTDATASTQVTPLPPKPDFAMPDKNSLVVILERPVFSQTRRPPARIVAGSVPPKSVDFTLAGVLISGSERSALLRAGNGGLAQQLKVGEVIAGWTLVEVAADRVIVRRDAVETEIFLDYASAATPVAGPDDHRGRSDPAPAQWQPDDDQTDAGGDLQAVPDDAPAN